MEVEVRTLIEVKESRMMPSSARQLLRPSRSFSCLSISDVLRNPEMNGGYEDRTSRSLSSCSYAADLCNAVSKTGLYSLQRDEKISASYGR